MKLFTKRHERALREGSLTVDIPAVLRGRIWKELRLVDEDIVDETASGHRYTTSVLGETESHLHRVYGVDNFVAEYEEGIGETDLKGFVTWGAPAAVVLDVVEQCWQTLWAEPRVGFQRDINTAFEEESCPWRLADGCFFRVDTEFLEQQVLANAHELLGGPDFEGAFDEFMEGRNDVESGDYKDAILKAGKSMESVLKVMLGVGHGNASALLKNLREAGAFDDLPDAAQGVMEKQVLMTLPSLRNHLGGHGQGGNVVTVPKRYAVLAVRLAAVFNAFLVEHHVQTTKPVAPAPEPPPNAETDDDIPF